MGTLRLTQKEASRFCMAWLRLPSVGREEKKEEIALLWELPCYDSFPHVSKVKQTYSSKKNSSMLVLYYHTLHCNKWYLKIHGLGSSIHGILQAGILEWVAISFSRGSSRSRDWTWLSRITYWATSKDLAWVATVISYRIASLPRASESRNGPLSNVA